MSLPIYSAKQIRNWDQFTILNEPISSLGLMERAASKCTRQILRNATTETYTLICGVGNNGGDGLAIARQLFEKGKQVTVYIVEFTKSYSNDFKINLDCLPSEISLHYINKEDISFDIEADVVIDAIFGSGLNRPIERGWVSNVIQKINASYKRIISIDIPSGLFCDDNSSNLLECVVEADETLTFQAPKKSFIFAKYAKFTGRIYVLHIGLLKSYPEKSLISYLSLSDVVLHPRKKFSHKGDNGCLQLIGGFDNMYGAIILSAKAAYRTGSGYVMVQMDKNGLNALISNLNEAVYVDQDNLKFSRRVKAIAIGPGLGKLSKSNELLINALESNLPLVIDADAINLLSDENLQKLIPNDSILTPHVKELERLIGEFDSEEELLSAQLAYSVKNNIYIIQKGAYSKLTCPDGHIYINSTGNEGMAVAGMGDVLTGIIGSFLAQGYCPFDAAKFGMLIHGKSGDKVASRIGKIGMLPTDLIEEIPQICNGLIKINKSI